MILLSDIRAWRWTDGGSNVEVLTADGWQLYSTDPHVGPDLAELRAAGVPDATVRADPAAIVPEQV